MYSVKVRKLATHRIVSYTYTICSNLFSFSAVFFCFNYLHASKKCKRSGTTHGKTCPSWKSPNLLSHQNIRPVTHLGVRTNVKGKDTVDIRKRIHCGERDNGLGRSRFDGWEETDWWIALYAETDTWEESAEMNAHKWRQATDIHRDRYLTARQAGQTGPYRVVLSLLNSVSCKWHMHSCNCLFYKTSCVILIYSIVIASFMRGHPYFSWF